MCNCGKPWMVASYESDQNVIQLESGSCNYIDSRDTNRDPSYLATSMFLWSLIVNHLMFTTAKSSDSYSKP